MNTLVAWLDAEVRSIPRVEMSDRTATDISDLKRRIAAGEYSLDAGAIAEAMFGAADRATTPDPGSEMLEAGELDGPSGSVDQL